MVRRYVLLFVCCAMGLNTAHGATQWNATAAQRDSDISPYGAGHALTLFNIGKFTFDGDGMFTENNNGTATLTGTLMRSGHKYDLSVNFVARTEALDYFAEPKNPKLELYNDAYNDDFLAMGYSGVGGGSVPAAKDGIIDPRGWRFYEMANGSMTHQTLMDEAFQLFARPISLNPEGEVGFGASGKNANMGLAQWVYSSYSGGVFGNSYGLQNYKAGDFNLDLERRPAGNTPPGGVPEPITATLSLMGLGVLGMATRRRAA